MASTPDNTIPAGGSETGATFGAALLFFNPGKGPPLSCRGGESHASMPGSYGAGAETRGNAKSVPPAPPGRRWRRYALDLFRMTCLSPVRHAVWKAVSSTHGAAGMARQPGE